jgi:hypothetical protein
MWIITLCGQDHKGEQYEHSVRIFSNRFEDLLENPEFRWPMLESLMEKGSLGRVQIDFRPSLNGVRRIIKDERGLYHLTIDNVIVSRGYADRGEAWAVGEK